jgi:hypothetical protein
MRAREPDAPSGPLGAAVCVVALVSGIGPVAACGLSLGGLAPLGASAYIGFTGSTGGISDSHNEIAGLTLTEACE